MIEIKSWCCGTVICTGESRKIALEQAVEDGVSLRYADLSDMYLGGAQLGGANLGYADLTNTNLHHAQLRGASIAHAKTHGATFRYTDLRGVCNTGVHLFGAQTQGALRTGMWTREDGGDTVQRTITVGNMSLDWSSEGF